MAYATADQIRAKLPKIASSSAIPLDETIEAIRDDVEALINAKIGTRYAVPFTTVPPLLRYITCILTARDIIFTQYVFDGQNRNQYIDSRVIEKVEKMLEDIVQGTLSLIQTDGTEVSLSKDSIETTRGEFPTIMDVDEIENSEVSTDLLDDIADERDE